MAFELFEQTGQHGQFADLTHPVTAARVGDDHGGDEVGGQGIAQRPDVRAGDLAAYEAGPLPTGRGHTGSGAAVG